MQAGATHPRVLGPRPSRQRQNDVAGANRPVWRLAIVEVINQLRPAGKAELRHDHFMDKLKVHPGINHPNFRGVYLDPKGEQRPCYYLPKREAELMVMSESLEVQTKVYDRLSEAK